MSIWPSIPCSPPKGIQISKYNVPYETLRHHYTRVRQRQPLPMKRPSHLFKEGPKSQSEVCQGSDEGQYDYHMTVQKARVERCTELKESEATYSKAISKNVANLSLQCATLCWEHMENMQELETRTLKAEKKSIKQSYTKPRNHWRKISILHTPFYWGHHHHLVNPSLSPQCPRWEGSHYPLFLSNQNPNGLLSQRGNIHQWKDRETCQWMKISPYPHRRNHWTPRKARQLTGSPPWSPTMQTLLVKIQILWRRPGPVTLQLTPGIGLIVTQKICPTYSGNLPKKLVYWVSLFLRYSGHGKDQSI